MKLVATRQQKLGFAFFVVIFVVAVAVQLFISLSAFGQGGQGSGGTGGACANTYCTDNGYGWVKYASNGGGPGGNNGRGFFMAAPRSWAQVSAICRDNYGTESVWVWVAYGFNGTDAIGFDYDQSNGYSGPSRYFGNAPIDTVRGYYQEMVNIGVTLTSPGLVWGQNIAWFCYTERDWNISTSTSVNMPTAEVGNTVTWTHTVRNNGPNPTNRVVNYAYNDRAGLASGAPSPNWAFNPSQGNGASQSSTSSYTIRPSDYGKSLCRSTSATPRGVRDNSTYESGQACVDILKRPKVHVLGGDLIVGRGSSTSPPATSSVVGSMTSTAGRYYGSWSEYGIVASGPVRAMASGSGTVGGAASLNLCQLSVLTFPNSGTGSCNSANTIGGYRHTSAVPNVASRFPVTSATPRLPNSPDVDISNLSEVYTTTNANVRLTNNTPIGRNPSNTGGRWIVINAPNTTVTIGSDINYAPNAFSAIEDIPQVIIIARNIIIADNVRNIDAWLVAVGTGNEGRINTCGAGGVNETTELRENVCSNQLRVNGPIIANKLNMRRTAGAIPGTSDSQAAEEFNLRADAYIWGTRYSLGTGRLPTVVVNELPPRF